VEQRLQLVQVRRLDPARSTSERGGVLGDGEEATS